MVKLKASEIGKAVFPEFDKINIFKSYGNKYFKLSVNHVTHNYQFCGYVCGLQYWADYTPEGLQEVVDWMNEKRKEVLIALKVAEEE